MSNESRQFVPIALVAALLTAIESQGQSSSLMIANPPSPPLRNVDPAEADPAEGLHAYSIFTVAPPRPHQYMKHDLVEIIVRETSTVRSKHEKSTEKDFEIEGQIADFPQLTLEDLFDGILKASDNDSPAKLDVTHEREFEGEGEVERRDDFSTRLMAQVIEVWPNGNLVLEARTRMHVDREQSTILLSGVCDPKDISPAGTVLSSQLFDLQVIKLHEGDLRMTTEKGLFTRALEGIFNF